ncbi:MAG: hypothetical protein O7G85_10335, partial [Planctomycetota bacterium]|nr:hypothetical protein [Planctomycetota bacterium]
IVLNLMGIYAITDLISASIDLIPFTIPLIGLLPLFIYIGLLAQRLEIEFSEAVIVGLLTFLAKMFIVIALMSLVM